MKESFKNKAFIEKKTTFTGCGSHNAMIRWNRSETKKRRQLSLPPLRMFSQRNNPYCDLLQIVPLNYYK